MDPKELAKARNSPENKKRLEELRKLADSQDARRVEDAKAFDPVALMARANEIHQVTHPQLGVIRFGELKLSDSELISKCKEKDDRTAMAVYLMLKKAYPEMQEYTPETIREFFKTFPLVEGTALLQFFLVATLFFRGKISQWVKTNQSAYELGLVLHNFPQYNFESIRSLTLFQYEYLVAWARQNMEKGK